MAANFAKAKMTRRVERPSNNSVKVAVTSCGCDARGNSIAASLKISADADFDHGAYILAPFDERIEIFVIGALSD
jgi:hypothetical protein